MKTTVIGCGRWGTCIAWYLDKIGHNVTLYGRKSSENMRRLAESRRNEYMVIPESVVLSTSLEDVLSSEVIVVSVGSQNLRGLMKELNDAGLRQKIIILCMKGIETGTGLRLSEVAESCLDPDSKVAVWLGPGHVQDLSRGIPNCMVIDSSDCSVKAKLAEAFSGDLIRIYIGNDIIGNEIGAAAKNVIGIAAGFLDALGWSSLKGALMARGAREISRLIYALGGNELSAYGLCHLGDYEATLFSEYSNNRRFGESFIKGRRFDKLAEGYYTDEALILLGEKYGIGLPICGAVYDVLYRGADVMHALNALFQRDLKHEFCD